MPNSAGGFRQENETKIDATVVTLMGNDDFTIVTKILNGKKLNPARAVMGVSNPYVDIRISPPDARFGDQLQRSSYKPLTVNPIWSPYERFLHTTNNRDAKVVFSLYHLRSTNIRTPPSLGDCVLNLSEINEEPVTKTLRLYDQDTGKLLDGELTITVQKIPSKKALRHVENIVYEYERWQPVIGWGNKSMLPTDPGCYSNEYGTRFAKTFNEVAPPVPRGWTILTEFHCLGNNWEYSIDLTRSDWYTEKGNNCFVRRRPWFREIVDPDYQRVSKALSEPPPAIPAPITQVPPTPPEPIPVPEKTSTIEEKNLTVPATDTQSTSQTVETPKPSEKPKKPKSSKPKPDWVESRSTTNEAASPMHAKSNSSGHLEMTDETRKTSDTSRSTTTIETSPTASKGCCVMM